MGSPCSGIFRTEFQCIKKKCIFSVQKNVRASCLPQFKKPQLFENSIPGHTATWQGHSSLLSLLASGHSQLPHCHPPSSNLKATATVSHLFRRDGQPVCSGAAAAQSAQANATAHRQAKQSRKQSRHLQAEAYRDTASPGLPGAAGQAASTAAPASVSRRGIAWRVHPTPRHRTRRARAGGLAPTPPPRPPRAPRSPTDLREGTEEGAGAARPATELPRHMPNRTGEGLTAASV